MNVDRRAPIDNPPDNNVTTPPSFTHCPGGNNIDHILRGSGWLCGFRVDDMDEPQATARQVASYVGGGGVVIQEINSANTELITTYNQRAANYVHHGWSVGAVETISPWTLSRIDAKNRHNEKGEWITRRTLAQRLRVQVLLKDLSPVPEFEAAVKDALQRPSNYEKFRAVYDAMSRWGDVIPLGIEIGSSLTLTDREANFNKLPETSVYNSLIHLSTIKTAHVTRIGGESSAGWEDGRWIIMNTPATEWRPIRIFAVSSTLDLLSDDTQAHLTSLYDERLSYVPPLTIDPVRYQYQIYDDTNNASRTVSKITIYISDYVDSIEAKYLDSVPTQDGKDEGMNHTFALTNGEHIIEMLTCADDDWLRGVQFITNKGRCSAIYGVLEGTPIIVKSKGGVLAGLSVTSRKHPQWDYLVTSVRGIWRHDLVPWVPKENDIYSDYFGARIQHGTGFNDRALMRNSCTIYISSVEVWADADIDSIQFAYTDIRNNGLKTRTARHGGFGGNHYRFELRDGEHIVSISGRYNEVCVSQLCFGTNLARTSEVYGRGNGRSFSVTAPFGSAEKSLRLQYILGKKSNRLNGVMFVWTPNP